MSDHQQLDSPTNNPSSSSSSSSAAGRPSSPSSSSPPQQHLNLQLQPNSVDDPSDPAVLPSFRDVRAKTLRALYGIQSGGGHHPLHLFVDKSPKGSVDEAIRPLVDLINAHPSYATLSSCSGRIALFDPSGSGAAADNASADDAKDDNPGGDTEAVTDNEEEQVVSERDNVTTSGKGSGRWALSSHAQIAARQLIDILNDEGETDETKGGATASDVPPLMFKHEPLLLHVAASTLPRAAKLLSLALSLGFRESGIVATAKRVTVAIRGVGLSLTVPLARRGALRPSDAYVVALVEEANQRFVTNETKLRRLFEMVEMELFVPTTADGFGVQNSCDGDGDGVKGMFASDGAVEEYEAIFEPLPKLGLWGCATVALPPLLGEYSVLAFGGHGTGPDGSKRAARSGKVYELNYRDEGWDEEKGWECIDLFTGPVPSQFEAGAINTIHMQHATLGAREGLAACVLPRPDNIPDGPEIGTLVAMFGGRAGPAHPSDELLLYEPFTYRGMVWKPTDVRGEPPAARWGHTFTALSGRNGNMAMLCGGRSTRGMVPTCHVLTLVPLTDHCGTGPDAHSHFLWETVNGEVSLFQHVAVNLSPQQRHENYDELIIFGGKDDSTNLFGSIPPGDDENETRSSPLVLNIDLEGSNHGVVPISQDGVDAIKDGPLMSIGASGCLIDDASQANPLLVVSGGVPSTAGTRTSALSLFREMGEGSKRTLESVPVRCSLSDDASSGTINVGSLVRHSCLVLPHQADDLPSILLVGGGVSSFAFGPSFANSYHVTFQSVRRNTPQTNLSSQGDRPKEAFKTVPETSAKESMTGVVYVEKPNAKALKNELSKAQLLDKNYRMVSADASSATLDDASRYIAVPVVPAFAEMSPTDAVSFSWFSLIAGNGRQVMPFSTKVLGNRRSHR